jgi:hypothetical protein
MPTRRKSSAVLSLLLASVLGAGAARSHQTTDPQRDDSAAGRDDLVQLPQARSRGSALTEQFRADEPLRGSGGAETRGFVWSRTRR